MVDERQAGGDMKSDEDRVPWPCIFLVSYCFFFPLFVSVVAHWPQMPTIIHRLGGQTMAAWVQGGGSLLAIAAAVYIDRGDARRHRRERYDALTDKLRAIEGFGRHAVMAGGAAGLHFMTTPIGSPGFLPGNFDEIIEGMVEVSYEGLPPAEMSRAVALRRYARQARELCGQILEVRKRIANGQLEPEQVALKQEIGPATLASQMDYYNSLFGRLLATIEAMTGIVGHLEQMLIERGVPPDEPAIITDEDVLRGMTATI
ncbi:hypothetical protein ASD89_03355 [Caulobacter sp. Root656]|nr:hypothetical protein ASD89_03355 [Caulobacter sp. Root656]